MVKLRKLTLSQNESFSKLEKEGLGQIWGGTGYPTFPFTPTPYVCPNDAITTPFIPPTYPITPRR